MPDHMLLEFVDICLKHLDEAILPNIHSNSSVSKWGIFFITYQTAKSFGIFTAENPF